MTIPAWPGSLPQALLLNGYSEKAADVALRSPTDAGPGKIRRRFTAGVRPVSGTMVLTETQLTTFKTFYNTTLLGGTLRFSWREPLDPLTAAEYRFVQPPEWSSREGDYLVSMKLEVLP